MANESLTFSIGADTKSFTDGIGGAIAAIGGLVAAFLGAQSVIQAFSEAINLGGRLNDLSTRTGETAGNLALLERAFENTSVGAEKLGPAIAKMQDNIVAASKEGSTAAAAFERLGLTFDDLLGKTPIQQLELIGERLSGIADPARRAQVAIDIFGRAGSELIPVLVNMGDELDLARSQLGSLPQELDSSAKSIDSLGDNLAAIGNKATEFAFGILSEVVPALEEMTGKLSRLDAAGIGAEFGQALVGAFAAPMAAVGLLGEALVLGAKLMGNELVFQIRSWSEILFNTFSAIGSDIIPLLGNSMTGAFGMAAGTLGNALASILAPVADMLGLDFIGELAAGSQQLMVDGAAKIAESANAFAVAFEGAKQSSTVVREDFFGAEGSSEKIAQDFASLQQSAKSAVSEFNSIFTPTGGAIAEFGGGSVFGETGDGSLLFSDTQAELARMAAPVTQTFSATTTKTKTIAQLEAEQNAQLALIAAANPNSAIGRSRSAQKVLDLKKELETLQALGQGGTSEAIAIQRSIDANKAIALGASLTADELDVARDQAMADYWRDPTQKFSELEDKYRADLLADKLKTDPELAQREKAAEVAKQKEAEKPVSMQSIVNSVLMILQKIEPKIPQHIMS